MPSGTSPRVQKDGDSETDHPPGDEEPPVSRGAATAQPCEEAQRLERLAEELLRGLAVLRGSLADGPRAGPLFFEEVEDRPVWWPSAARGASSADEPPEGAPQRPRASRASGASASDPGVGARDEQGAPPRGGGSQNLEAGAGENEEWLEGAGKSTNSLEAGMVHRMTTVSHTENIISDLLAKNVLPRSTRCETLSLGDIISGVVIMLHIVCIGFSTEYSLTGRESTPLDVLEQVFLSYYIVEMIVHLRIQGCRQSFTDRWFIFDVVLVSIAVVSQWLFPLVVWLSGSEGNAQGLERTLIVRVFRLVRPLRALRYIDGFKDVWRLLSGIFRSTRTVLNACILIFVTLYVFALVGVDLVRKDESLLQNESTADLVTVYFGSVFDTVLTLVQFANADSIASIYQPLIRSQPHLAIYFCALWIVVTILIMNLVTAVVIQNAIDLSAEDAEAQAREKRIRLEHMVPLLKEAFENLDTSQDGVLQHDEIQRVCGLPLPRELREIMQKDRMKDLFWVLDNDESGDVSREEFVNGICHIALSTVPIETTQILSMLRVQGRVLHSMHVALTGLPPDKSQSRTLGLVGALGDKES